MKRTLMLFVFCLSLSTVGNAQTRKPVRKTAKPVAATPAAPSANGKFKLVAEGLINDSDSKNFVIITAQGKNVSDIKSSIVSTLSSMYNNPSKVISTLGDNIINVTATSAFDIANDVGMFYQRYNFTYNIKIEVKDGKIKIDAPSFSNINRRDVGMLSRTVIDSRNMNASNLFADFLEAKAAPTAEFEELFNSHITKIVSGLSSSSEW